MSKRKMAVAGQFYPNNKEALNSYFEDVKKQTNKIDSTILPRACIVPHAGYIYSGLTANIAYNHIAKKVQPSTIFVLGPSHRVAFEGCSISLSKWYETPLGDIEIDNKQSQEICDTFNFVSNIPEIHKEHSTETQMPFIKYYFPNTKVVEIIYGNISVANLTSLVGYILQEYDNFVVISTDLSHFFDIYEARAKDNICLNAITNLSLNAFSQGCEACGMLGIKAILTYGSKRFYKSKLLDYRTSAEQTGDTSSVVGYCSFVLG